jgi:Uma2 family endonuclease
MTVALSPSTSSPLLLSGVTWAQLESLETAFQGIAGVRLSYLAGNLEIMTLSQEHEDLKSTLGLLLETYLRHHKIRFYKRGSATLGTQSQGARKEPDESYNFDTKKSIPDLVIEVIISSGSINILEIYQRIGIPEVWLWLGGTLTIYYLTETGYQLQSRSQCLPSLDSDRLAHYANYADQYDAITEFSQSLAITS